MGRAKAGDETASLISPIPGPSAKLRYQPIDCTWWFGPNQRETKPAQIFDRTRIYDRIDARRDLSLGEVHLDTALVGPRKAFAKCNRRKLNSLCSNTWSLSRCETAGGLRASAMPAG